jgi:hypothetical protein
MNVAHIRPVAELVPDISASNNDAGIADVTIVERVSDRFAN